uniref:Uncharacterized protein n=1 Tax=Chromera velia CCMP2878 TaxID=1169474 RepID=A0A0G4F5W0_9ALVE|eukprot:Cvel_2785.t1-p1 / transcript=Cvel_2785.t1 / gene=Cvel_2785 / organism=Chromera_velia_CCMP2878 / gene_product=hypothetical protein / transcript_product=hypothetical protein / location=Cvel_scaffold112:72545-76212(+) / protein_length=239 / sequence_SO=supercontig / SO=protein_coding / is_pseudo=false
MQLALSGFTDPELNGQYVPQYAVTGKDMYQNHNGLKLYWGANPDQWTISEATDGQSPKAYIATEKNPPPSGTWTEYVNGVKGAVTVKSQCHAAPTEEYPGGLPVWAWIFVALGGLLVLGAIAFLVYWFWPCGFDSEEGEETEEKGGLCGWCDCGGDDDEEEYDETQVFEMEANATEEEVETGEAGAPLLVMNRGLGQSQAVPQGGYYAQDGQPQPFYPGYYPANPAERAWPAPEDGDGV